MRQLIGKNGCNFKFLTKKYSLQYVWWNKKNNVIELWGKNENLLNAKEGIQKYIENFKFAVPLQRCNASSPDELNEISAMINDLVEVVVVV